LSCPSTNSRWPSQQAYATAPTPAATRTPAFNTSSIRFEDLIKLLPWLRIWASMTTKYQNNATLETIARSNNIPKAVDGAPAGKFTSDVERAQFRGYKIGSHATRIGKSNFIKISKGATAYRAAISCSANRCHARLCQAAPAINSNTWIAGMSILKRVFLDIPFPFHGHMGMRRNHPLASMLSFQ